MATTAMRRLVLSGLILSLTFTAARGFAQERTVQAQTIVTVVSKDGKKQPSILTPKDLQISANYKSAPVTTLVPLTGARGGLELIVLIDDSARTRLGEQLPDLRRFVNGLPREARVGVAYMQNGQAVMVQNLTPDHEAAAKAFRLPRGSAGSNASPYFCLSDLARRWPSNDPGSRREVLMVTDGEDPYGSATFDPSDTYVMAAITDAERARLIVHSIYYRDAGDGGRSHVGGQDYLLMVSRATGGKSYYQMSGDPVSFAPYLEDLHTRLMNQYELGFLARPRGRAEMQAFKVKTTAPRTMVEAPERVMVGATDL